MCLLCDDEKAYLAYMNYLDAMERQDKEGDPDKATYLDRLNSLGTTLQREAFARPAVVGDGEICRRPLGPAGRTVVGIAVDGVARAATNADQRTRIRHGE